MRAAFLSVSAFQFTGFNENLCYCYISLNCFWKAFWHRKFTDFTQKSAGNTSWGEPVNAQASSLLSNQYPVVRFIWHQPKEAKYSVDGTRQADRLMLQALFPLEICLRKSKKHSADLELIFEQQCTLNLWAKGLKLMKWTRGLTCGPRNPSSHTKKAQTEGLFSVTCDCAARNWRVSRDFQQSIQMKKLALNWGARVTLHKDCLGEQCSLAKANKILDKYGSIKPQPSNLLKEERGLSAPFSLSHLLNVK